MAKEKSRCICAPYINREYSWLQFDDRVLDQARDPENPLLERCRFLSIFISNLDEFVRVRLGSLLNLELHSPDYTDNKTGMSARDQIDAILGMLPSYYRKSDETFTKLRKELKKAGVDIILHGNMTDTQKTKAHAYFQENIVPFLSPLILDAKHPMIRFENQRLYLVLRLERDGRDMFGVVTMGMRVEQLVPIPGGKRVRVVPSEELLYLFAQSSYDSNQHGQVRQSYKRLAGFTVYMEQILYNCQMAGAAYRDKFCDPLDQSKKQCFDCCHFSNLIICIFISTAYFNIYSFFFQLIHRVSPWPHGFLLSH